MMKFYREWSISTKYPNTVKSLNWQEENLVDWIQGGTVYSLDGQIQESHINYAYIFDAATVSPSGRFSTIYQHVGTKGLILNHERKIVREINRSFYYANAFEYPIVLFQLPDGREVIAHCPDQYDRIEIEDTQTGERLTACQRPQPKDIFHSRLSVDLTGRYLMSAGWVWSPWDIVNVYDISSILKDPSQLDTYGIGSPSGAEVLTAAFGVDSNSIIMATSDENEFDEEEKSVDPLRANGPHSLGVYDLTIHSYQSITQTEDFTGTMMAVNDRLILSFYHHPKLVDLRTGKIIYQWKELDTGDQTSCITWGRASRPPIALDPRNCRFAVASPDHITIIALNRPDLERLSSNQSIL
jgi:hypothetical protein